MSAPTTREAIAALVHRYADAVVRRDKVEWASCWAEDAQWHLSPGRSVEGRAAIADLWTKAMGQFAAGSSMSLRLARGSPSIGRRTARDLWACTVPG